MSKFNGLHNLVGRQTENSAMVPPEKDECILLLKLISRTGTVVFLMNHFKSQLVEFCVGFVSDAEDFRKSLCCSYKPTNKF